MHPTGADQEPLASMAVQANTPALAASIAMVNIPYPEPAGQQVELVLTTGRDSVRHKRIRSPK